MGQKIFCRDAACVELLKRRLELQPIRNTKLLAITVYSEDKKECADLANAVAWDYAVYRKESRQAIGRDELDALSRRYQDGEQQISQLQNELEQLRRKFNLSDTPGAEAGLLAKYQGQLVEQKMACQTLAAQFDKLTALDGKHLREVLPTVSPDSLLVDLLGKLNAAEQSYAGLTNDYASSDLHITRVRSSMDILNHQIDDRVDGLMAGLRANLANQREELASLQATVEDLDKTVQINAENTPEKQSYQAKKRHLETLLDFQKLLAAKLEAARLDLEISTTALVQIIDEAQPQNAPARPNKPLNILLGAIFGLLLGGVAGSIAAIIAHRVARPAPKPAAG